MLRQMDEAKRLLSPLGRGFSGENLISVERSVGFPWRDRDDPGPRDVWFLRGIPLAHREVGDLVPLLRKPLGQVDDLCGRCAAGERSQASELRPGADFRTLR